MASTLTGIAPAAIVPDGEFTAPPSGRGVAVIAMDAAGEFAAPPTMVGIADLLIVPQGVAATAANFDGVASIAIAAAGLSDPVRLSGIADLGIVAEGASVENVAPVSIGAYGEFSIPSASGRWLLIRTEPPVQVYAADASIPALLPSMQAVRCGYTIAPLSSRIGRQNDQWRASILAPTWLRRQIVEQAAYRVGVALMDGRDVVVEGVISGVRSDAGSLTIDVDADRWAELLPIRTSADMGEFRDVVPLPLRYGREVAGDCVQLGPTGRRWLWADHASQRVRSVTVAGVPYDGWTWRNETDRRGRPVTVIETVDSFADEQLAAVGDGAMDRVTGALLTSPAAVVLDLCRLAGVDPGDMTRFAAECQRRRLTIAGSVSGGTLQATLTSIAESVGAIFARRIPGTMRLYPVAAADYEIEPRYTLQALGGRDGVVSRLRARYAFDSQSARASIEVVAPEVARRIGEVVADIDLRWIANTRTARDVATRMLAERARPQYLVAVARQKRDLAAGDATEVEVVSAGISGVGIVESSTNGDGWSEAVVSLRVGAVPSIIVAQTAEAWSPDAGGSAAVETVGGDSRITIRDPAKKPIVGAQCTLDGAVTRVTDDAGRVAFPAYLMTPGAHRILVVADGYEPFTLELTV